MSDEKRRTSRYELSATSSGGYVPLACIALPDDEPAAKMYAAYNRAGDRETAGLNYQGKPCPAWEDLTENVREKWRGATHAISSI